MAPSLPPGNAPTGKMLALAFAAVVSSFFAANFIVQRASGDIGALSEAIIYNASPSIEHLAQVRRVVLEAELTLSNLLHEPTRRSEEARHLEADLKRLNESTRAYLGLPALPGEQPLRLEVQTSWLRFDEVLRKARTLAGSDPGPEAVAAASQEAESTRQHFLEAVTRAIEHDAVYGRELAGKIRETRERSRRLANLLNVVCGAVAVALAWLLHRQARTRQALYDAHADFLRERAAEMEQFAGRVAHDIRNPLSAARMAAELAVRKSPEESPGPPAPPGHHPQPVEGGCHYRGPARLRPVRIEAGPRRPDRAAHRHHRHPGRLRGGNGAGGHRAQAGAGAAGPRRLWHRRLSQPARQPGPQRREVHGRGDDPTHHHQGGGRRALRSHGGQ